MKKTSALQVQEMLDRSEDFHLVNVLPEEAFDEKRIPGSVNVPVEDTDFLERMQELVDDPGATIVVYCASTACQASPRAARRLEEAGYRNVIDFEGGLEEWERARLPLEGSAVRA